MTSFEISAITGGKLTGSPELKFSDIVTDSRQLSYTEGQAFVAIRGKNHDGHQFVDTLYGKGIRIFIVERLPDRQSDYPDAAFIEVRDSIKALHDLASHKREQFRSPVVAVTGSAGKTVVKEWLADIIGLAMPVIRSPRSYNSQIGVPLSVWKLSDKFRLGIFEAGISIPGEMEKLERIIRPDIGVITNIGDAHSENFSGNEAKAREKLKLFKNTGTIIYSGDQEIIHRLLTESRKVKTGLIDWSFESEDAAIRVTKKSSPEAGTEIGMTYQGHYHEFTIPFNDRASVENAITAASVCLALDISPGIIRKGLSSLVSVAMRMEIRNGIRNCLLIEDYYNSDPGSLGMALEYIKTQNGRKTTLILSDFVQSGRDMKDLYGEVAEGIRRAGINRFIGIGPSLFSCSNLFSRGSAFFYSTEEFIHHFNPSDFSGEAILLKGARRFEFEKIGKLLEQQVHQTMLEVNLDAISHNLNEFRRFLNPGTRIMAMVKAFAYGAGPSEIAALLEYHRVSWLGVAYADEGVELREAGVALPVMVMNPDPSSLDVMIRYNLEPVIYSTSSLKKFVATASRNGLVHYPVHIKIDTGMHRLGFMPDEIDDLALTIASSESLKAATIFSHFAASEDPSLDSFTRRQALLFTEAAEKISKTLGYPVLRHICNSAAIVRFPEYQFEMVRPGIGIYGACSLDGLSLKPAGRFRTKISQVKKIPAGEPVGYGCKDSAGHERIIGIVPVGYADGLNRKLGNRNGEMLVRNRRVKIIGSICMDMCMIDITGTGAAEGDDVEIFGDNIHIEELASKCQTIPYEILTSIPARVKRVFFRE
ncbi:MAG: bifunctional UDP-N-acetylmuramoyl-tripeptide:D-alanyl-D-alanine ligase/alanine racemase [Bacteroidales bacterium]|nr:bifunctional UDP-N-acetylmuramoyl-tripeptide:D-alanyl-D-alanine ligase/alanine racemase [Bacteroidales bacterium]